MKDFVVLDEVLKQYGMENASYKQIRHNENMTYCIDNQYLLRIHKEKPGFNTVQYFNGTDKYRMHESELEFLQHLKKKGVEVQSPINNIEGNTVTSLRDGTIATMLTWIPGRTVDKSDLSEEFSYQLGEMIAKLHIAGKGYRADNFIHYNQELCQRLCELLTHYFKIGELDKQYHEILINAFAHIGDKLKESEMDHMLIHADLSLSNILITDKGLVPIDFSLMGYSDPLLDFGSLYCFINNAECRNSAIKGYEDASGCWVNTDEIKPYFALQILLGITIHFELWKNEEWFVKRLPQWCSEVFYH